MSRGDFSGKSASQEILSSSRGRIVQTQKRIAFIGEFKFPFGDAASVRTLSLARLCRDAGYEVEVIGKGRVREEDYDASTGSYFVDGIEYSTMNPKELSMKDRFRSPLKRIKLFETVLRENKGTRPSAVVINACSSARHVPFVQRYCRSASVPLIADVCEWYDVAQFKRGRLDPAFIIFSTLFRWYFPRLENMIVVSRLLEDRFKTSDRNIIRIPAPIDVDRIRFGDATPNDRLILLYAGIPGKKDLIKELLLAMTLFSPADRERIELRLLGPTIADLNSLLGREASILNGLGTTIKALGRVTHQSVIAALHEAHFSVLFRPNKRYANAGFPSKVPESLAAGTPVIMNVTSDLGEYLENGISAIFVRGCQPEDIFAGLQKALSLDGEQRRAFRCAARKAAEKHFDYRQSSKAFEQYLAKVTAQTRASPPLE